MQHINMKLLAVISVYFFVEINSKLTYPSYISICKRNDPDLSDCLLNNILRSQPHLKHGIPKMWVPALDPLKISQIGLNRGNLAMTAEEILVYNLDDFKIHNITVDLDRNHIDIDLTFPFLEGSAGYTILGRLLLFDLNGSGKVRGNISELNVHLDLNGELRPDGHLIFNNTTLKLKPVGDIAVYFENLFGDREDATRATNDIINQNINEVFKDLSTLVEQALVQSLEAIFNGAFSKFTFEDLFL